MAIIIGTFVVFWLIGAFASLGVMSAIGAKNLNTINDSFSGDDVADLVFASLWPISWLAYCAFVAGRRFASR